MPDWFDGMMVCPDPPGSHSMLENGNIRAVSAASSEKNTGDVLVRLGIDTRKGQPRGPPLPQIGKRHVAGGLRIVESGSGIALDELWHSGPRMAFGRRYASGRAGHLTSWGGVIFQSASCPARTPCAGRDLGRPANECRRDRRRCASART